MPKEVTQDKKTSLPEDSFYFNTDTGDKLDESEVKVPPKVSPIIHKVKFESLFSSFLKKDEEKKSVVKEDNIHLVKKDNSKMISILSVVVTVGSIAFIFLYLYTNFFTKPAIDRVVITKTTQQSKNATYIDTDIGLATGDFNSQQLISSVPENATIYMEFNDLYSFLDKYVQDSNFAPATRDSAKNLLEQDFALFSVPVSNTQAWAFVLIPKDIGVLKEVVNTVEHPEWDFRLIGDVLIVANNREVFTYVTETKRGEEANLAQTPAYSKARTRLGTSGEALVIFLAQDASRNLLSSVTDKNLSSGLLDIINTVLETELYELILRKHGV